VLLVALQLPEQLYRLATQHTRKQQSSTGYK
jgi:hypothetical protein